MNLKVGIVGLPNAGKSTLFNALLKKQVAFAANYPFATIEPNVGVVPVPDERLDKLAEITMAEEKMDKLPPLEPAVVEFVDIAGLVKGASEGQGLGNKFLSHIRETDLICNVIRVFPDPNIVHVAGDVDPLRDKEIIETELILADLQTLEKQQEPKGKVTKEQTMRWELIQQLKEGLNQGKKASDVLTDDDQRPASLDASQGGSMIYDLHLLSMKPVMVVANVAENQLTDMPAAIKDLNPLLISAETESQLASLSAEEQKEYLTSLGLERSGLDRLIRHAYEQLGLISFLTSGVKECRAWTIAKGMKAPQAAGVIHTDFEKKFIKADVVAYDAFVEVGGWKGAREKGKARFEGKEYVMQDGDVVEFKIGS